MEIIFGKHQKPLHKFYVAERQGPVKIAEGSLTTV